MDKFKVETRYNGEYHNIDDLILKRAGLVGDKREFFLNPNHDFDYPFEPVDIDKGVELFNRYTSNDKSKIGLLVDPDVDGFTSASILQIYLSKKGFNPIIFFQEGKEHGLNDFVMNNILKEDIDFLIITDAGSNDIEQHKVLHENNIDILIIDHHQIEGEEWYKDIEVPVINNHREDNPIELNKELTGVGMTLRFLEYVEKDRLYGYYYLAALGQIGDSSDVSEPEIRNIVIKGIDMIPGNSFISYILSKEFKNREYYARDMSFTINPYINALVRVGTMDEKEYIFDLLTKQHPQKTYKEGYKILKKIKTRQKTIVDNMKQDLTNNINNDGGIAIGYVENPENKTVIGLVANNLVNSLNKPVLLLRDKGEDQLTGSGRGLERVVPSLKNWCEDTNLTEHVGGHDNAFGLSIKKDNLDSLLLQTKNVDELEYVYDVDNIYYDLDSDIVREYDKAAQYIGGSIEDMRIAVCGVKLKKHSVISRGSVTLFNIDGVEYIIFNDFGKVAEELKQGFGDEVAIDIVGKPNMNHWAGRVKPQVIVEDVQRASGDVLKEDIALPQQKLNVDMIEF